MPWRVFKEEGRFCVHKLTADGEKGEKVACHDTETEANAQVKALYANVQEIRGIFTDVMVISELRGAYPNIPISSDVDYAALIAGDPDPVFISLPIGKANVKSNNNRYYDEAFVMELMRQTLANKPIGLMGHMAEAERATAFKPEALHWVGAVRDGDLIWGKAYILGEAHERVRRYKASGKTIATSIDAFCEGKWDDDLGAYRMKADTLKLNQIDLAPTDRAGVADLAVIPHLTAEMEPQDDPEPQEEPMPEKTKLEHINELTADDARLLPKAVRDAIVSEIAPPPEAKEVAQMAAIRETLGLDDKADVAAMIAEMKRTQEAQRVREVQTRITELATTGEKAIKLESVRGIVVEMVKARQPQNVEQADTIYGEVVEMESVKRLLQAEVRERMGPPQRTPVAAQPGAAKYFQIPEKEA